MTVHDQSQKRPHEEVAKVSRHLGSMDYGGQSRILLLTPVAPPCGQEGPHRIGGKAFLSATTTVDGIFCRGAPESIQNRRDAMAAAPLVLEKVRWAQQAGYDAVVINCMLDPGLKQAKGAVDIPVVGIREAATSVALLVGARPAYIYPTDIDVLDLNRDPERAFTELVESGRKAIRNQGADVLIPNCAYLGGLADRLRSELGVPVLANEDVALKMGELLATFRLHRESGWVAATRSRTKILLSTLYAMPIIGPLLYRVASLVKQATAK